MRKRILGARRLASSDPADDLSAPASNAPVAKSSLRHHVYIVECSDGSLYTGYTTDPARRIAEHNRGSAARYTRTRRPVKLVYLEEVADRAGALRREARIKKLGKNEKLRLCIKYEGNTKV
ncbi:MAG: GIY-YIG nuclease family protein, partial [Nitrososphaerales archaeon]|nr:GIY-YIG nuclease family protein [Nitrososphaerales archaeon]